MENRTWLVKANETKCNHRRAFGELGMISWRMDTTKFSVGDVVYVYFPDRRQVEIKAVVTEINAKRYDLKFWKETPTNNVCATLKKLVYKGNDPALSEIELLKHGYKKGCAQQPMYNNPELFEYLNGVFDK